MWNLEDLTDEDIHAAIRYLDPDPAGERDRRSDSPVLVICVSILVLLMGLVALIWLYCQIAR